MKTAIDPERVILCLEHPQGEVRTTLAEWMVAGPGPRSALAPFAALDAGTGEALDLSLMPLRYRNSALSRWLIRLGVLKRPWR